VFDAAKTPAILSAIVTEALDVRCPFVLSGNYDSLIGPKYHTVGALISQVW